MAIRSSLLTLAWQVQLLLWSSMADCEVADCEVDGSAYLQRRDQAKLHVARGSLNASTVTCGDRGTLVFDFSDPNLNLFQGTDVEIATGSGIFYRASQSSLANNCNGFAIWTQPRNVDDDDLLACPQGPNTDVAPYCNLLVVSEDGSTPSAIDDCRTGGSEITLEFSRPQEILSFKWWDNEEDGTTFTWINEDGNSGFVDVPTTPDEQGTNDVPIASVTPLPSNVQFLKLFWGGSGGLQELLLCNPPIQDVSTTSTSTMIVVGDPHIDTLDKQHYLLLKQGTFSSWRFSGPHAEIYGPKKLHKKLPVDFKIFSHFSGHTSYTKGLLLVDASGTSTRVLELTSELCIWRTKAGDSSWSTVDQPQMLSLPDADGDEMTAFKMKSTKGRQMYVELLMKEVNGFKTVAKLYTRCKPGYHINVKISMSSKDDTKFVKGQLGGGRTEGTEDSQVLLQGERTRSDREFMISQTWIELGGSEAAATYLDEVDEEGSAVLKGCSKEEQDEATAMCKEYMGEAPTDKDSKDKLQDFQNHFQDCVFDVCNGGGEMAAEMAAEIIEAE